MSLPSAPESLVDKLWRSILSIVLVVVGATIALSLLVRFIGPILLIGALLLVFRLILGGVRSRRGW